MTTIPIMPSFHSQRAFLLIFFTLFCLLAPDASAESYPAGIRLSVNSPGEAKIWIDADGPSLLWIRAEAPGLVELQAGTDEIWSLVPSRAGSAECVIPVYRTGPIEVRVRTTGRQRVVVTTNYGLGAVVTDERIVGAAGSVEPMRPSKSDALTTDAVKSDSAGKPATMGRTSGDAAVKSVETSAMSPAASDNMKSSGNSVSEGNLDGKEPGVAVSLAPDALAPDARDRDRESASNAKPTVPIAMTRTMLVFGDVMQGDLAPSNPRAVRSFRVYAPNRAGFEASVTGNFNLRVKSEKTDFDVSRIGDDPVKRIAVPPPTSGYYTISIQGLGEYQLTVKSLD